MKATENVEGWGASVGYAPKSILEIYNSVYPVHVKDLSHSQRFGKIMRHIKSLSFALLLSGLIFGVSSGCRISSSDSVSRNVGINIAGVYRGANGNLVQSNTGAPIRELNVIQDGSRLQAIDNNGLMFRGNIGSVEGTGGERSASFTLEGLTSSGAEGIISGTIRVSGDTANMTGTWAEPSLFSTVSGRASISGQQPEIGNGNGSATNNVGTNGVPAAAGGG